MTSPEDILAFEKSFFTTQYEQVEEEAETPREFDFLAPSKNAVSEMDRNILNEGISIEEMEKAVKNMKNGKCPDSIRGSGDCWDTTCSPVSIMLL